MHIAIDNELAGVGQVRGSHIALQQAITNLFVNGADAIKQEVAGWNRVYPVNQNADQQNMADICFEDNWTGISKEQLPRFFERGYS